MPRAFKGPVPGAPGSGVRLVDVDHGYQQLVDRAAHFGTKSFKLGVLAKEGAQPHRGSGGATVVDVATWNEFGVKGKDGRWRIPPRSFIRSFVDVERDAAIKMLKGLMQLMLQGKLTEAQALDRFGVWAVGRIQARMSDGIPPANAKSTVQRKGSSTPLIDTGQLRSSVSYEVLQK